jgi:hypothetical protein
MLVFFSNVKRPTLMKEVLIPDTLYKKLQSIAIPFEDTVATVIERLLDEHELKRLSGELDLDEEELDLDEEELDLDELDLSDEDELSLDEDEDELSLDLLVLNPDNPDSLYHTRVLRAILGGQEIYNPKWNKIVHTAHRIALQQGIPIETLIKLSLSNVVKGKKIDSGFHYLPDSDISIQGMDSNQAWKHSLDLMKYLKLPIEVHFKWRDKEEAAFPNQQGMLAWKPK